MASAVGRDGDAGLEGREDLDAQGPETTASACAWRKHARRGRPADAAKPGRRRQRQRASRLMGDERSSVILRGFEAALERRGGEVRGLNLDADGGAETRPQGRGALRPCSESRSRLSSRRSNCPPAFPRCRRRPALGLYVIDVSIGRGRHGRRETEKAVQQRGSSGPVVIIRLMPLPVLGPHAGAASCLRPVRLPRSIIWNIRTLNDVGRVLPHRQAGGWRPKAVRGTAGTHTEPTWVDHSSWRTSRMSHGRAAGQGVAAIEQVPGGAVRL